MNGAQCNLFVQESIAFRQLHIIVRNIRNEFNMVGAESAGADNQMIFAALGRLSLPLALPALVSLANSGVVGQICCEVCVVSFTTILSTKLSQTLEDPRSQDAA